MPLLEAFEMVEIVVFPLDPVPPEPELFEPDVSFDEVTDSDEVPLSGDLVSVLLNAGIICVTNWVAVWMGAVALATNVLRVTLCSEPPEVLLVVVNVVALSAVSTRTAPTSCKTEKVSATMVPIRVWIMSPKYSVCKK